MTFDEWWKENGIEMATFAEKSAARKGWNAGTNTENEACAKINDAPHFKIVVRNELKRRADAIRASMKS